MLPRSNFQLESLVIDYLGKFTGQDAEQVAQVISKADNVPLPYIKNAMTRLLQRKEIGFDKNRKLTITDPEHYGCCG